MLREPFAIRDGRRVRRNARRQRESPVIAVKPAPRGALTPLCGYVVARRPGVAILQAEQA